MDENEVYQIARGWIAFICSIIFIIRIGYVVTRLTDLSSCVTGFPSYWRSRVSCVTSDLRYFISFVSCYRYKWLSGYVIAFTVLAGGTLWPDFVASRIAAEHQQLPTLPLQTSLAGSIPSLPSLLWPSATLKLGFSSSQFF